MNMRRSFRSLITGVITAVITVSGSARAQNSPDWSEPFPPFRIAGNLYYVGASDITSYLITTPKGHIVLDGGFVRGSDR